MESKLCRLELPADISSLRPFTEFIARGAQEAALPERDRGHLELVLEEILVNVMRYAYPEEEKGTIEVEYAVEGPGALRVQVCDAGREFDPLAKDPPDLRLSLADRPVGGLGIYLMKQITRSLTYNRVGEKNILGFRLEVHS